MKALSKSHSLLFRFVVFLLIFTALVVIVLKEVDVRRALVLASGFPFYLILAALVLTTLILVVKGYIYYLQLSPSDPGIRISDTVKIIISSQIMTPFPGGELGRGLLTKEESSADNREISANVITQIILELSASVVIVLLGSFFFNTFRLPAVLGTFAIVFILFLFLNKKALNLVTGLFPPVHKKMKDIAGIQDELRENIVIKNKILPRKKFVLSFIYAVGFNILGGLVFVLLGHGLGVDIDILKGVFLYAASIVIQGLLSIVPAGIGFTEGGLTGLLVLFGVHFERAVAIVLLFRSVTLLYYVLLGLVTFVLFYRHLIIRKVHAETADPEVQKEVEKNTEQIERHTIHIAFISFVFLIAVTFGVGILVQKAPLLEQFDTYFYELIANGPHYHWLDILVYPINVNFLPFGFNNMPSFFLVLLLLFFVILYFTNKKKLGEAFVTVLIGIILSSITVIINTNYMFRQRPFTVLPNNLSTAFKNSLLHWTSFPSGHARDTTMFAVIIATFIPALRIPMILFTAFVVYSRVYVGAHYPTDVLAGIVVGYACARVAFLVVDELKIIRRRFIKNENVKKEQEQS